MQDQEYEGNENVPFKSKGKKDTNDRRDNKRTVSGYM